MKRTLRNDQSGMVAIIVTMIMMFVIVLIVLGFAQVTRRNSRESLDTQLGMQAYYAAETGVNDITNGLKNGAGFISHSDCSPFAYGGLNLPRTLSTVNNVANTCLMVDSSPGSLVADTIAPTTGSVVWDVKNASPNAFKAFSFSWRPDVSPPPPATPLDTSCLSAVGTYPTLANWKCDRALLRVDIVRADVGVTDADSLASNTVTLFLQPGTSDSAAPTITGFGGTNQAAYQRSCRSQPPAGANLGCTVNVSLAGAAQANEYYMRLTSVYLTARTVTLTATDAVTNAGADFANGQVVIDSTGRAQDQIKRIKVRIPLTKSSDDVPVFAAQGTGDICKEMMVSGGIALKTGSCDPAIWQP
jgi:hypothetical protein